MLQRVQAFFEIVFISIHIRSYNPMLEKIFHFPSDSEKTHWKQSVVFLPEMLASKVGYDLRSKISISPDENNPRFSVIDIQIGESL